jgi:hypothetical protein
MSLSEGIGVFGKVLLFKPKLALLASLTWYFVFYFFTDTLANYSNRPLFAVTHSFFSVPPNPFHFY